MIRTAFERVALTARVRFLSDAEQLLLYLQGTGKYGDRLKHPSPDVVLVDLELPGRTGFDVLRWLRDRKNGPHPRVIVLSTSENLRDVNEAYRMGAASFFMKPIDPEDFRNTMSGIQEALLQGPAKEAA